MSKYIEINNIKIEYRLIRMKRKTISINITEEGILTIKLPTRLSEKVAMEFVNEKRQWIYEKYNKVMETNSNLIVFRNASIVPYKGVDLIIKVEEDKTIRPNIFVSLLPPEYILFKVKNIKTITEEDIYNGIKKWYIEVARWEIEELCKLHGSSMGVTYNKIYIKEQRTVWGSCSGKNNLNFNWKLIMMPEVVMEYVVVHELAHLIEMNHSDRFWLQVEKECPRWRQYRTWLKQKGYKYKLGGI